jgi:hypothetical protein
VRRGSYGLGTWAGSASAVAEPPAKKPPVPAVNAIDVLFSPKGGCTDRIVRELAAAFTTVAGIQAANRKNLPLSPHILICDQNPRRLIAIRAA